MELAFPIKAKARCLCFLFKPFLATSVKFFAIKIILRAIFSNLVLEYAYILKGS